MSFNQVTLLANLTRDPVVKFLPSQTAVAEFGVATNRKWKTPQGEDREEVCFIDCACFGKRGEALAKYFGKGRPIFIVGHLKFDSWEDKNGGGKRSKLSVIVDEWQFAGGNAPGGDGEQQDRPERQNSQRPPAQRETVPPQEAEFGSEQFKDDDIPF